MWKLVNREHVLNRRVLFLWGNNKRYRFLIFTKLVSFEQTVHNCQGFIRKNILFDNNRQRQTVYTCCKMGIWKSFCKLLCQKVNKYDYFRLER